MRSWRATANGLEGAAASTTDTCLVLDELGVGEARDVACQRLCAGERIRQAASAARRVAARAERLARVRTVQRRVACGGEDCRGLWAQGARRPDHPASRHSRGPQARLRRFRPRWPLADAGKLADTIKDAARSAYGTAGPEFVRRLLASGGEHLVVWAKGMLDNITRKLVEPGASEQIARAAKKFALIGVAGELATHMGVTPWAKGGAFKAASSAFERWLEVRGGAGSHEARQAIEQVRLLIVQHGGSRFDRVDPSNLGGAPIIRDRLGWVKGEGNQREWWVPPETWRAEFCEGLDPISVARTLASKGMLRRQGDGRNLTCVVAIPGDQKKRCYVLTANILGE